MILTNVEDEVNTPANAEAAEVTEGRVDQLVELDPGRPTRTRRSTQLSDYVYS